MNRDQLAVWLRTRFAQAAGRSDAQLELDAPFDQFGLDSATLVGMSGELGEALGRSLPASLFYEFTTLRQVVEHVFGVSVPGTTDAPAPHPAATRAVGEEVAIVGLACRLPGAQDPQAFWQLLCDGRDAIGPIPTARRELHAWSRNGPPGSRVAGMIGDVARFDHLFFGISRLEANEMDPQQRLLLEITWEALEDAGTVPSSLRETSAGVFLGMSSAEYSLTQAYAGRPVGALAGTGNANSITANRLSYFFNLHGPSLVVDTACSGSLVALHLAVQSLRRGESSVALVGSASCMLSAAVARSLFSAGVGSAQGRCMPFSNHADGIVRGEGVVMAVLKLASRAIADGDRIYACICGSALCHDGRTHGLTAPSGRAQRAVIEAALADAAVSGCDVSYVECHGTGTRLGDPIEARALGEVVGRRALGAGRCGIGSVKSNIGHTEAVAGMAGLLKVALALQNRQIPASLHADEPHDAIDFQALGLRPVRTLEDWPNQSQRLVAGVSAFGFGGTNAHVVLREAVAQPVAQDEVESKPAWVLPVSARDPAALRARVKQLLPIARGSSARTLPRLAHTLCVGREHLPYRLAVVGSSPAELAEGLERALAQKRYPWLINPPDAVGGEPPSLTFVFSGYASQSWQMGRETLRHEPVFAQAVERCDAVARALTGWSLSSEFKLPRELCRLGQEFQRTQLAIFAIQLGLIALLRDWGVTPQAVVGHSQGEIAAACAAGVLSIEEGVRVIVERGRALTEALAADRPPSLMAYVDGTPQVVEELLHEYAERIYIASYNSPTSWVLGGEREAMSVLLPRLQQRNIYCRAVAAPGAAHHPELGPMAAAFAARLRNLPARTAQLPMFSTVLGGRDSTLRYDSDYWARSLREPVRFAQAVDAVLQCFPATLFVELGPHPQLTAALKQCVQMRARNDLAVSTLSCSRPEYQSLLKAVAQLHCSAVPIAWAKLSRATAPISLPVYPWQGEDCWFEDASNGRVRDAPGLHKLAIAGEQAYWQTDLDLSSHPYIADHRVGGVVVVPGTYYVDLALQVAREITGHAHPTLLNVEFERLLALDADRAVRVQISVASERDGWSFEIQSALAAAADVVRWTRHARGRIALPDASEPAPDVSVAAGCCTETLPTAAHYARMEALSVQYGPRFRLVQSVRRAGGMALGEIELPTPGVLCPMALDACLQVSACVIPDELLAANAARPTYLPVGFDRLRSFGSPERVVSSTGTTQDSWCNAEGEHSTDVLIRDHERRAVLDISGFRVRRVSAAVSDSAAYRLAWQAASDDPVTRLTPGAAASWYILPDRAGVGVALCAGLRRLCRAAELLADPAVLAVKVAGEAVVVDLRLLDAPAGEPIASGEPLAAAIGSLVDVVEHLARLSPLHSRRLWIITRGAQATAPGEAVGILPSAAWGFGRSLALEHPALWGGLFDLDPQYDCDTAAAAILQHIAAGSDGDQAAIRGERLLVPRLVRAPEARARTRLTIRADAAYLITGGLGGLGLALAEWLVRAGARCLVLTRRPHPAGERASTPSSAAQSTALERLRRLGASVVIEAADAGNLDAMRAVIERIGLTLPPLRGVFHLAGVAEPKRILELTTTEIQTAFHAKALGAFNLHLLTRAYALDHFVLFSSAAAVWGSTGLAHYAAANQVLDALALHRISRGLSALSIEWGMWNEIGMAAGETAQQLGRSMGLRAMAPHHALSQLEALLRAPGGVYTVADVAWSDFKALFEADPRRRLLSAIELTSPSRIEWLASTDMRAVLRTLPFEAAVLRLEAELQAALAQSLGVSAEEVASDKSLDALGLDSLLVLELKTRFETSLGVSIPVMQLLGAASLRSVCVDLVSSLRSDAGATVHDLESEARLDESLRPHPSRKLATREHGTLLTGVTGFLGAALLAELLRTTDTPILCLVRAKDEAHARARIHAALRRYAPDSIGSERVVPVLGDLATERLGLDEGGLADVRARVSTIIHSGAWLNPVYSYAELRPTNVDGTRELLRLACSGSAMRVVHISSLAVFPWDRRSDGRRFAEASAPSPQGLPDGYCQTKWVAERLVEQAAERGLAAIIVRPGLVVGHSRTGIANDQDLLGRLIKGCVQMGCYPALSGKVDLTPVDYAARVIARLVHGATTSRFYHVTNPQWLEWTTLFEWIAELVPNLEAVSFDAWKQRLQMAPDGNVLRYLLPLLGLSEEMITGQRSFETCRTEHALEGTGISCPLPSRELVRSYARYYLRAH